MRTQLLLTIDAIINLGLGLFLLLFPRNLVAILGLPAAGTAIYPSLLGAVLLGIGIALLIQRSRAAEGLGLLGAIVINMIGGAVLAGWLAFGSLNLPLQGRLTLWALVVILVGLSVLELFTRGRLQAESGRG